MEDRLRHGSGPVQLQFHYIHPALPLSILLHDVIYLLTMTFSIRWYNQSFKMFLNFWQVMVDDVEADEEGIVDVVLDDNAIRQVPRPGTSLR